jgi:hypothetical protein
MHRHMKQRMWNGRARCVVIIRQTLNHHAYQLRTGMTALIAWHRRTGGDVTQHFGQWRPPRSPRSPHPLAA